MHVTAFDAHMRATRRIFNLLGTASFATLAGIAAAQAAAPTQPAAPVEEVLITGSVISGSAAVGVTVTAIGAEDFRDAGALTVADIIRTLPAVDMMQTETATASGRAGEKGARVDLRSRAVGGERAMLMVDSLRYPGQFIGGGVIDPSIIPEIAIQRVEVLTDGASSLYGSDAVAGVINIILKRRFDGAVTQTRFGTAISDYGGGMNRYQVAQLFGRTWSSGSIVVSYEFNEQAALDRTAERLQYQFTMDFTPWGLDNRQDIASSRPATVTSGAQIIPDVIRGPASCTNCFSIPKGTGWDFGTRNPGATISWAGLMTHPGTENLVNPYALSDLTSRTQRNAAVLTFDQQILDHEILGGIIEGATLNVDAFYSNRRSVYFGTAQTSPGARRVTRSFRPPTSNPYYPTGAPSGLRVHYTLVDEINPRLVAAEIARRWSAEVELELPLDWAGRLNYAVSDSNTVYNQERVPNANMTDAALGLTVASVPASGTTPGQAAFTKPANIPYLNLFCDATTYRCNSPATLNYIAGYRHSFAVHQIHEWNAQFDGPIYTLPGGEIRAGIGAQLRSWNYNADQIENYGSVNTAIVTSARSIFHRQVPAFYAQLNVPVFSDMNAIPLLQRLVIEGSYRYDNYYDAGPITSPKVSGEWSPGFGLTLRASWGESFRAPSQNDLTPASARLRGHNLLGGGDSNVLRACPVGSLTPVPGSAGERLVRLGLASCNGVGAPLFPGGVETVSAAWPPLVSLFRPEFGTGPAALQPETATNLTYGFAFDPDLPFLSGLHLEANYWRLEIDDVIDSIGAPDDVNLLKPDFASLVITPDNTGGDYNAMIRAVLANTVGAGLPPVNASDIVFLIDGSQRNFGKLLVDGYDFGFRYDYDAGNFGAFSLGLTGSYYLNEETSAPGFETFDNTDFDVNPIDLGVSTVPRLKWRGHVGWSDGTFTANAYINHTGHYHGTQVLTDATARFPNWSNIVPAHTTLDVSLAYNTGAMPVNEYLQNINLQVVVNDVLDKKSPFAYITQTGGGNPAAFDGENGISPVGRYITFYMTKTW
jgi:iron complex outermembrane recepter protein